MTAGGGLSERDQKVVDDHYAKTVAAEPELTQLMRRVETQSGTTLWGLENNVKGIDRVEEKVANHVARGYSAESGLPRDIVRYTCGVEQDEDYAAGLQRVHQALVDNGCTQASGGFSNRWPGAGYNGVNMIYTSPDGDNFEVQVHTPESYAALKDTHPLYEVQRTTPASDPGYRELQDQMDARFALTPKPPGVDTEADINPASQPEHSLSREPEEPTSQPDIETPPPPGVAADAPPESSKPPKQTSPEPPEVDTSDHLSRVEAGEPSRAAAASHHLSTDSPNPSSPTASGELSEPSRQDLAGHAAETPRSESATSGKPTTEPPGAGSAPDPATTAPEAQNAPQDSMPDPQTGPAATEAHTDTPDHTPDPETRPAADVAQAVAPDHTPDPAAKAPEAQNTPQDYTPDPDAHPSLNDAQTDAPDHTPTPGDRAAPTGQEANSPDPAEALPEPGQAAPTPEPAAPEPSGPMAEDKSAGI